MKPCIERRYLGGSEEVNLEQFAQHVVQEHGMALEVAEKLVNDPWEYAWNEDQHPQYYEEFYCTDRAELTRQIKAMKEDQ